MPGVVYTEVGWVEDVTPVGPSTLGPMDRGIKKAHDRLERIRPMASLVKGLQPSLDISAGANQWVLSIGAGELEMADQNASGVAARAVGGSNFPENIGVVAAAATTQKHIATVVAYSDFGTDSEIHFKAVNGADDLTANVTLANGAGAPNEAALQAAVGASRSYFPVCDLLVGRFGVNQTTVVEMRDRRLVKVGDEYMAEHFPAAVALAAAHPTRYRMRKASGADQRIELGPFPIETYWDLGGMALGRATAAGDTSQRHSIADEADTEYAAGYIQRLYWSGAINGLSSYSTINLTGDLVLPPNTRRYIYWRAGVDAGNPASSLYDGAATHNRFFARRMSAPVARASV